jgi:hypothetical protein
VGLYLSYLTFMDRFTDAGLSFSYPRITTDFRGGLARRGYSFRPGGSRRGCLPCPALMGNTLPEALREELAALKLRLSGQ